MFKNLILIAAAALLSAAVCATVEVVQAGAFGGGMSEKEKIRLTELMEAMEKTPAFARMREEAKKREEYIFILDLMRMRSVCANVSEKKATDPVKNLFCYRLSRFEALRRSLDEIEARTKTRDTEKLPLKQSDIKRAEEVITIYKNYREQQHLWSQLQVMLGFRTIRNR